MSVQKEKRERLLALAEELANDFATRAAEHDQNNTFPFENVARMKETGYTALVLPEAYGGSGADLVDFCSCQERLAQGCGATALAINMHLFGLGSMVERGDLVRPQSQQFAQAVGRDRQIIGGGITEPETGGNWGLFVSRAVKDGDSYVLNGRKVFTSLAPVIDLFMVMVTVQDPEAGLLGGTFLLPKGTVAMAALNFAKEFANRHQPLPLPRPIKYLPGIQFTVAEAETLLAATRAYTLETAKAWVNREDFSGEDGLRRVCMPKYFATNNAIRIVDLAMEIVGAVGIFKKHPLERYYRDVRAGTNHPFSNARMRELVGKNALGTRSCARRQRWYMAAPLPH